LATLGPDSYVFSLAPDHSTHLIPSSVTQRFRKLAARLGLGMHIHQLRHYSATELISAGVDIRTVAGRLGHAGGGTTTLRVYAAWMAEADQRAAAALSPRMPGEGRPGVAPPRPKALSPYECIAAEVRTAIESGAFPPGSHLPTTAELATMHTVAVGTASRAIAALKAEGLVEASRGKRVTVKAPAS